MLFKIRCLCNLKLGKQFSRIAALAVISRQHILCHRLPESSGTADADLLVFSKQTFIGERNQGYFNAGLFSMNFVNALHSQGIGSCFVQFGNSKKDENIIKKICGISSSERIAVLVSAGYYEENISAPKSPRKDKKDVFKIIE